MVPFLKIDKGLADEADGVQLMKPMPELEALLDRAKAPRAFSGPRCARSSSSPIRPGIAAVVAQQFEVAKRILAKGLMPIIEPEVSIKSPERDAADRILLAEILKQLDALPDGQQVMLKLTIPAEAGLFAAAGRPSQGAARGRAVGRLQPRRGLPRAGQEPGHDRQLQPRAAVGPSRTTRATRNSTARWARRSTRFTAASVA